MGSKPSLSTHAAVLRLAPLALEEKWSVNRLAKEAGVSRVTASAVIRGHKAAGSALLTKSIDNRVTVARQAQETALARLPRLQMLLEKAEKVLERTLPQDDGSAGVPMALDEFGEPEPVDPEKVIKATHGLIRAGKDLHSYMEQVTGLDVVKAVSIRAQTQQSGPVTSWDGIGSLEQAIEAEVIPSLSELTETASQEEDDWV